MTALLYIDLIEKKEVKYEKEIINLLSSKHPGLSVFDIDYQSDSSLIEYAKKLIKDCTTCILYIESDSNHSHKAVPIIEEFLQNPEKFIIFLEGENPWISKLTKGFQENHMYTNVSHDEVQKEVSKFITSRNNCL